MLSFHVSLHRFIHKIKIIESLKKNCYLMYVKSLLNKSENIRAFLKKKINSNVEYLKERQ
jgi:hypothetical protein